MLFPRNRVTIPFWRFSILSRSRRVFRVPEITVFSNFYFFFFTLFRPSHSRFGPSTTNSNGTIGSAAEAIDCYWHAADGSPRCRTVMSFPFSAGHTSKTRASPQPSLLLTAAATTTVVWKKRYVRGVPYSVPTRLSFSPKHPIELTIMPTVKPVVHSLLNKPRVLFAFFEERDFFD